jgi:hypothetical protein
VSALIGVGTGSADEKLEASYTVDFASFGPGNTDLFIADADGKNQAGKNDTRIERDRER